MPFRVAIAGGRGFTNYPLLRATLDALLANRLPDVEILTTGGAGVPMLAASYATERGLPVTAMVPEFGPFPEAAAVDRRDAELVSLADAVVVVPDGRSVSVRRIRELAGRCGKPLHVVGEQRAVKVKRSAEPEVLRP